MSIPIHKNSAATLNNFDVIRLLAALQVAVSHIATHLNLQSPVFALIEYFPGVPVFFFISGYLIYQSYANISENKLRVFFINRVLRLFPGLYLCFLLTALSVFLCGYLESQSIRPKEMAVWIVTSLTFLQFYNPEFLRGYGVGAINGSLWTISVELQFYALTPLLFLLYQKHRKSSVVLFIAFVGANLVNTALNTKDTIAFKLLAVSFVPWFYMFMLGAYLATQEHLKAKILTVNPLVYLVAYGASYVAAEHFHLGIGNGINPVSYLLLCLLVFSLAYRKPEFSNRVLKGNDISYGIYIYHMPVVNLWLFYGLQNTIASFVSALAATAVIAAISWSCVEKPALRLKKIALRAYA